MEGIKNTVTETFKKILGNDLIYSVPKFQRDYSWEDSHWEDLWLDLNNLYTGKESEHYMGYLVVQAKDQKEYRIIDGQQRITTLSILIIAVLKCLKELEEEDIDSKQNKKRRENLHNLYIGFLDPVTLIAKNKLNLNRNNDDYYKTYIVPMVKLKVRNTNASEKRMRDCFDWYYKKVKIQYKTGEDLARFTDTIVSKLYFTVITVGDELNAYKVFETLEACSSRLLTCSKTIYSPLLMPQN